MTNFEPLYPLPGIPDSRLSDEAYGGPVAYVSSALADGTVQEGEPDPVPFLDLADAADFLAMTGDTTGPRWH